MAFELEHVIGYTGTNVNTILHDPSTDSDIIYSIGASVVIQNVTDPHQQTILREHDAEISCMEISRSGKTLVTCQFASPRLKGEAAPVLVWDYPGRAVKSRLSGIVGRGISVDISHDGHLVAVSGKNRVVYVWDIRTEEVLLAKSAEGTTSLVRWCNCQTAVSSKSGGGDSPGGGRSGYVLATSCGEQVIVYKFTFDLGSMSYNVKSERMQLPGSGLHRTYTCGIPSGDFFLAGTATGEVCVFNIQSGVFRFALPVCSNGVKSMSEVIGTEGRVIVGGGDGKVVLFEGADTKWNEVARTAVSGAVTSIKSDSTGTNFIAGSNSGAILRLSLDGGRDSLLHECIALSHTNPLQAVTFGNTSDVFATCTNLGEAIVWELAGYSMLLHTTKRSNSTAICFTCEDADLLVAYEDGSLRSYAIPKGSSATQRSSAETWEMPVLHKGGVSAVRAARGGTFFATGGNDGFVRVWSTKTRELVSEFASHARPVLRLVIDCVDEFILHSCGADRTVTTYDLKKNRKVAQHSILDSHCTSLSQRKDSENELVTSMSDGRLLFWDVDVADPVKTIDVCTSPPARLLCVEISPDGTLLACAGQNCTLYIFDVQCGELVYEVITSTAPVTSLAWSPDNRQLITVSSESSVAVWNNFS